jgi:hypothetical protein
VTDEERQEQMLELLQMIRSLPYRALNEMATIRDRPTRFLVWLDEVRTAVEEHGVWHEESEWRIGTVGGERLDRVPEGYRATTTAHGEFSATFRTFPEAYEAMSVFHQLQTTLFYAIGWSTWRGGKLPRPRNLGERYVQRLSRAARAETSPRGTITQVSVDWGDTGFAYRVLVERGSFRMTVDAVDESRAAEFAGIFARLQEDLLKMLDWRPVTEGRAAG